MIKYYINKMKTCYQIPNIQTVYDHCCDVANTYTTFITDLKHNDEGSLFKDFYELTGLQEYIYPEKIMIRYLKYHDIGKPLVVEQDEFG